MIGTMGPTRRLRQRLLQAVLFSLTSSFLACGPQSQIQRTSPRITAAPQVRSEVLIMPLGQKMKDELPYWTMESQRLVLAYFDVFLRHGLERTTTSRVIVREDGPETDSMEFDFQNMGEDGGPEWWAFVPLSGRVAHAGRYPDYVLIFDGLRFRIRSGGAARQSYDNPGGGKVELDLEYVLWDNRTQEVAAFGQLHEEAYTNSPHPSSEIYKGLFEKMAEEVVRNTPLTS